MTRSLNPLRPPPPSAPNASQTAQNPYRYTKAPPHSRCKTSRSPYQSSSSPSPPAPAPSENSWRPQSQHPFQPNQTQSVTLKVSAPSQNPDPDQTLAIPR